MKILWVSNGAFTGTGYGTATKSIATQLQKNGHDPHILSYWGLQGTAKLVIEGIPHYAPRTEIWGNDYMEDLARFIKADLILVHRDIWVTSPEIEERTKFAAWFPVDHFPISDPIVEHVQRTKWRACLSQFGVKELNNRGVEVDYVPHSFDSNVFNINGDRKQFKKNMGFPEDAFVISMVAANKGVPSRKGFPEMYEAIAEMQRRHKDVWAYCHSLHTTEHGGLDLKRLADYKKCDPERFLFIDPFLFFYGIDQATLSSFYKASDVFLNTSYGEGFGIPILEAQACGIPVVTTNCTAMPEITFNGYSVNGTNILYNFYAEWMVPKVGEIVDALEELYKAKGSKKQEKKNEDTAKMLYDNWRDEAVYENYWQPWLAKIENELVSEE